MLRGKFQVGYIWEESGGNFDQWKPRFFFLSQEIDEEDFTQINEADVEFP